MKDETVRKLHFWRALGTLILVPLAAATLSFSIFQTTNSSSATSAAQTSSAAAALYSQEVKTQAAAFHKKTEKQNAALSKADGTLLSLATYIEQVDIALCAADHAECPSPPTLP